MKRTMHASTLLAAFYLLLSTFTLNAQNIHSTSDIPRTISYQGMLSDMDGSPLLDGTYPITVTLYADPTGSLRIWQETYSADVKNGIFNLYLGSGNVPLPDPATMNTSLWIGTQIGDGAQMFPLTPLSASAYALNVSDKAITTGKLADGAVTADKVNMDYIAGVEVNDQMVTGAGTVLKLKSSEDITLDYDEMTNSITIASNAQSGSDKEKGGEVQDAVDATNNWLGRDPSMGGVSHPFFALGIGYYNTLAGGFVNAIEASCDYSTIAGGGDNRVTAEHDLAFIGGGNINLADESYAVIGGGRNNEVSGYAGVIVGGWDNTASGDYTMIGGGRDHQASGDYATVTGGYTNIASGNHSFIGGGETNEVTAAYSVIGGGESNEVESSGSAIVGGDQNRIYPQGAANFVGGGSSNEINSNGELSTEHSGIASGLNNTIGFGTDESVIAGGLHNEISDNTIAGFIGGGNGNKIWIATEASTIAGGRENNVHDGSDFSGIGSGQYNHVGIMTGSGSDWATIGGGKFNRVEADYGTVAGGEDNHVQDVYGAVGGGYSNFIYSGSENGTIAGGWSNAIGAAYASYYSAIGGGKSNKIDNDFSVIGGGQGNAIGGNNSTIPGGYSLRTTGFGQTAIGYLNDPRGTLSSLPSAGTTASTDDPLFMIGNGSELGMFAVLSNAFEVSYNGHSVVYDVNGTTRTPIRGATYVDNVIYAWGEIAANGGIDSEFGILGAITHTLGTGFYVVEFTVADPETGAPVILTSSSVTATIKDVGDAVPCAIIAASDVRPSTLTPGANMFTVRIRDLSCHGVDAPFMFKVTGRP